MSRQACISSDTGSSILLPSASHHDPPGCSTVALRTTNGRPSRRDAAGDVPKERVELGQDGKPWRRLPNQCAVGGGPAAALAVIPPVSVADFADPDWIAPLLGRPSGSASIADSARARRARRDYTSRYPYSKSGRVPLPDDCVIPDPLDTLAYVAGFTTTLGLATGLLVLPMHNPLMLAKRAATVDRLSGGRLRLAWDSGGCAEIESAGVDPRAEASAPTRHRRHSCPVERRSEPRCTLRGRPLPLFRRAVVPSPGSTRGSADRSGRNIAGGHPPGGPPGRRLALPGLARRALTEAMAVSRTRPLRRGATQPPSTSR